MHANEAKAETNSPFSPAICTPSSPMRTSGGCPRSSPSVSPRTRRARRGRVPERGASRRACGSRSLRRRELGGSSFRLRASGGGGSERDWHDLSEYAWLRMHVVGWRGGAGRGRVTRRPKSRVPTAAGVESASFPIPAAVAKQQGERAGSRAARPPTLFVSRPSPSSASRSRPSRARPRPHLASSPPPVRRHDGHSTQEGLRQGGRQAEYVPPSRSRAPTLSRSSPLARPAPLLARARLALFPGPSRPVARRRRSLRCQTSPAASNVRPCPLSS